MKDTWSALSDPTRRAILSLLRKRDMNAGEIAEHFDMSKPSISKHLDVLRSAGLVSSQKHGQFITYTLRTSVLEDLTAALIDFTQSGGNLK